MILTFVMLLSIALFIGLSLSTGLPLLQDKWDSFSQEQS